MNRFKALVAAIAFAAVIVPAFADEAAAPATKSEGTATTPVVVSTEVLRENAALGVMQGHMNMLLTSRDALNVQIDALQKKIDEGKAMVEKLAPSK